MAENGNGSLRTIGTWLSAGVAIVGGAFVLGQSIGLGEGREDTLASQIETLEQDLQRAREHRGRLEQEIRQLDNQIVQLESDLQRLRYETGNGRPGDPR